MTRHKLQESIHIFACPRLFTSMWRSHVHKSADLIFEIPARVDIWGPEMHKPLIVACCFPSVKHNPWFMINTVFAKRTAQALKETFEKNEDAVPILKNLFKVVKQMQRMTAQEIHELLSN